MTFQEIFERVLVESGQFLLSTDEIELNSDRFLVLVRAVLAIYNKTEPYELKFNLQLAQRSFTFTTSTKTLSGAPTGIPDGIADMIPVRIAGISSYFLRDFDGHKSDHLQMKAEFPWEYRKPTVYVPLQGTYDVHAWYSHTVTETSPPSEGGKIQYSLDTISHKDDNFFKLLRGKFLQGLGSSRKAFTITDLPIITDAADLVTQGKDLEKEAIEALQAEAKWWLAWG
jgi:hypothetical protein